MLAPVRNVLLIAIVAGCQAAPVAPGSTIPVVTASAPVPAAPTAEELEAIRFRTDMSLEANLKHVRAVAANPTATMEFGVPLLPSEFAELMSRSAGVEEILAIVHAEAAKAPSDYCGSYIDNANNGALTSGWKANRIIHELAIRSQVQPGANLAFIDCPFSEVELNRVCDRLHDMDHDWMLEIPAQIQGYGCGNMHFRVEMQISSAVPDAADQVLRHYASLLSLPPGILVVESDETGVALVEWGEVRVFVTRPDGSPVGDSSLGLLWEPEIPGLACGRGDVGFGIPSDGKPTKLPCQEGRWTIQVAENVEEIYGAGTVAVKGGETVDLHITLDRDPPPIN